MVCHLLFVLIVPCIISPAAQNDPSSLQRKHIIFASSLKSGATHPRRRRATPIRANCVHTGISGDRNRDCVRRFRDVTRDSFRKPKLKSVELAQLGGMHGGGDAAGDDTGAYGRLKDWGISLSLFLTYLTVMGAKCALPTTLSMLVAPNSGLAHNNIMLTRQDVMSRLIALSTVSIAAGKLLLGPVIDSLGGIRSLQIALSTICLCLSSIGFGARTCPTLTSFAVFWIVVDFAFSSCWAACVKTIRENQSEERWSGEIGRLAIAARLGNALSFAFFGLLLQWASSAAPADPPLGALDASWRWVFRVAGAIQLIPLFVLSYFGADGDRQSDSIVNTVKQHKKDMQKTKLKQSMAILRYQSCTPEFWLHLVSRSLLMVLVSFLLFIPSFMAECYDMSHTSSARVGSLFALGCLLSVSTLAKRTYPISQSSSSVRRKAYSMLGFLTIASLCSFIQIAFLQDFIQLTPVLGSFIMFIFGFSLGE